MAPIGAWMAGAMVPAGATAAGIGSLTTAQLATGALIGGMGLTALGQYQAGMAASAQAESQAAVAEYNARVQEAEAKSAQISAEYQSRRQAEAAARQQSALLASLGMTGAVPSEGTPLLIQSTQAAQSEMENLMIGYEAGITSRRALSQAAIDRLQAASYRQQAGAARTGAWLGAGTTLLSGFGARWG